MPHNRLAPVAAFLALLLLLSASVAHAAISAVPDAPTWTAGFFGSGEQVAPDGDRAWFAGSFNAMAPRTGPGTAIDTSGKPISGYAEMTNATAFPIAVSAAVGDGSGGWYVAGNFQDVGGVPAAGLVHLHADGSLDSGFNAQATAGTVQALALSGGVLYAGGSFTAIGGQPRSELAALDPVSGSATGWTADVTGANVQAIDVGGGFVWVGGFFTKIGTTAVTNAAKIPVGTTPQNADATYLPNPNARVRTVLFTASNTFLGGDFSQVGGVTSASTSRIAKTDPTTGAPDPNWHPNADGSVYALAQDGTNIYAGGAFSNLGGATRKGIGSVPLSNVGGGAATTWYPGPVAAGTIVQAISYDAVGTVYFGGTFTSINGVARTGLASAPADATGNLSTWDPVADDFVNTLAATNSAIYAGGTFTGVGGVRTTALASVDLLTGAPMSFFSHDITGLAGAIYTIAVCGNTVYIGGSFASVDGVTRLNAAAFDRNTGALTSWNPDLDNDVDAIACGNGVVYLGGIFQFFNTSTTNLPARGGLAATDPVTGQPTAWDPGVGGGLTSVSSLAVSGSTVYVGGSFTNLGNPAQARNGLAAIDTSGAGAATAWNPNVTGGVSAVALGPNGELYAGGTISSVGGTPTGRAVAVRLSDGTLDPSWAPAPDGLVRSMAVAPDGTVYMGGDFGIVGGLARPFAAAVSPAGVTTSWAPNPDNSVYGVAAASDGRVYLAGPFSGFPTRASALFATFSEPTSFATQPSLSNAPVQGQATNCNTGTPGGSLPAPTSVQWILGGTAIPGATGSTYTPTASDVGHSLSCRVSQTNLISNAQADSPSATIAAAPQSPAQQPRAAFDIDGFATPPPPQRGQSVIAKPASGTVTVLLPGFHAFIPLPDAERIPVGTIIDATNGVVLLTSVGKDGQLQSATFYGGQFQILQGKGKNAITVLKLVGGNFAVCNTAKLKGALIAAKIPKSRSVRHLWGTGKGLFRTQGRFASATIRGTKWLTDDRCDGTLIRVAKGTVTVRDIPKRRTLPLAAPKSYLAKAR